MELRHHRGPDARYRPLVLIGHSFGGLVIQQALIIARLRDEFADLQKAISGVIFLGTPFAGSDLASFRKWCNTFLAEMVDIDTRVLKLLDKNSSTLFQLSRDFWGAYQGWDIICFYENQVTNYGGRFLKAQTVSENSATFPGKRMMYLNKNHPGLNKFSGIDDPAFKSVLVELQHMVQEGLSVVEERFVESIKPSLHKPSFFWNIPRSSSGLFTGRKDVLQKVKQALRTNKSTQQKRYVITGMGGIGKSEICLRLIEEMQPDFAGIAWIDASHPETANQSFIALATKLGFAVGSFEEAKGELANFDQKCLLILDNADDPQFDYQVYLPFGLNWTVIITSRVQGCSRHQTVGSLKLDTLGAEDSVELLLKAAEFDPQDWPPYEKSAREVVECLGSHTLALIQAGAYVASGSCDLADYLTEYKKRRKRLLEFRPEQGSSRYGDVYATFEVSASALASSYSSAGTDALRVLDTLSMLHYSGFPTVIFEKAWEGAREVNRRLHEGEDDPYIDGILRVHTDQVFEMFPAETEEWDPVRLESALRLLSSFSLVTQTKVKNGVKVVSMHPLAHSWAKDRQSMEQQGLAWFITGSAIILSYAVDITTWGDCELLLRPHIKAFIENGADTQNWSNAAMAVLQIDFCCAKILEHMGDYELITHVERLFKKMGEDPQKPTRETISLHRLFAYSLQRMGMFASAIDLWHKILDVLKPTLVDDQSHIEWSQHGLAMCYIETHEFPKAITILESLVEKDASSNSAVMHKHVLGMAYQNSGDISRSIELSKQIIQKLSEEVREDDPLLLVAQHELGRAYRANGRIAESVSILRHVSQMQREVHEENHPERVGSEQLFAMLCLDNGQIKEAIELQEWVVRMRKDALAKDHPDRLISQLELARVYMVARQPKDAAALLEVVIPIGMERADFANNIYMEFGRQHLVHAYLQCGRLKEAISFLDHIVNAQGELLDESNRTAAQQCLAEMQRMRSSEISSQSTLFPSRNGSGSSKKSWK
ncbi:hypothetical protein SLS56_003035 [Neofusicoccum ribis]|uniref:NB-ARC domain-containing protein n=1 Tax=Neofusicoccum ribis TaxID=45134 RepID=A0ABR3T1J4_9PEZI